MSSAICTLFEGNYHFGVGTSINSVSKNGFKGSVFVGFKKRLPDWCSAAFDDSALGWEGAKTHIVSGDLSVHFWPITVGYQLTNYKPEFMIELFAGPCNNVDNIAYFDPDITNG
jgi:hypothetical protein